MPDNLQHQKTESDSQSTERAKQKSDMPHIAPKRKTGLKHIYWISVALFWLILWQLIYQFVHQDLLLASPMQVFLKMTELGRQSDFWIAVLYSLLRIEAGFVLAVLSGMVLAILTARYKWINRFIYPAVSAIRSTPIASFIILALVWMSSNRVVVFIVFLMVLPIVWTNVMEGIRKIDPLLLEMASVFQLNRRRIFRYIDVPSVTPFFIASATTGLGLAWKAGIAAEVLSTPANSLGGRLYEAKIYLETPELLAYTIVIIVMSLLLEKLLIGVLQNTGKYFHRYGRMEIPVSLEREQAVQDKNNIVISSENNHKSGGAAK